jgi:hypothetical protein
LVVTQAGKEHAGSVCGGHVETAALRIVNVLTIIGICDAVVACLETKLATSNKAAI